MNTARGVESQEGLTVWTPIYCLTPNTVTVAPTPTMSVAMPNAPALWRAPLKPSSAFAARDEEPEVDVEGTGSLIEKTGGLAVGCAIGMPLETVRRGGGGASASAFPSVAARCRRSITMGTTSAAEEKASYGAHQIDDTVNEHKRRRTRATGSHLGMGFLFLSPGSSTPKIGL